MTTIRAIFLLLPLCCAAAAQKHAVKPVAPPPAPPPPGYVTLFSHPLSLTSFMPGTRNGFYSGRIYEGDHQLAHLQPSRFVTFAVTPGSHIFAANSMTSKTSEGGGTLTLDIQSGQHYFVQASIKVSSNIMELAFVLKQVPCTEAQTTNKKSKAASDKDLFPEGAKIVVPDTTFPECPPPPTEAATAPQ